MPPLPAWTPTMSSAETPGKRDVTSTARRMLTVTSRQAQASEQISPASLERFVAAIHDDDLGRAQKILDEMRPAASDEHPEYYVLRAMYEARAGRQDKARELLESGLELAPGDATILSNLQKLGVDASQTDEDAQADDFGR
ncbi:tetratricopeptide repeat protein [Burkholderia gladioli]|uniref:tetratricopeptide repeat protein n=1 Tax=Burkholderia gladioli TaxID=28095 RepID=UPI0016413C2F|nr:tetratricopeptide repeat protein [Burkholderia gladioli]